MSAVYFRDTDNVQRLQCGSADGGEADTVLGGGSSVLRIVSGSENSELEPILEEFSDRGACAH